MKGGNFQRARGKHFSFTLLAVICMTVFLWSYEQRPVLTNILLSQDQLILPSDVFEVASPNSGDLNKPEDHPVQESLHVNIETEDTTETENKEETTETENKEKTTETENKEETTESEDKEQTEDSNKSQILVDEKTNIENKEETEDKIKPKITIVLVDNTDPVIL